MESALSDLKSIEYIKGDDFLTHIVAFHAQQCIEKCFKAMLEYAGQRVPKDLAWGDENQLKTAQNH